MSQDLTPAEAKQINEFLQKWASATRRSLSAQDKGTVTTTLRNLNKYKFGLMEAIGFKFPRHGVFVEMGVFGYRKGHKYIDGKAVGGTIHKGKRTAQPWFNPVINHRLPQLIDGLAEKTGDLVINAQRMLIKNTD